MEDLIYEDDFCAVKDTGPGKIDITIKQKMIYCSTAMAQLPEPIKNICSIMGIDYKTLQGYKVDDVKEALKEKYKYVKKNSGNTASS